MILDKNPWINNAVGTDYYIVVRWDTIYHMNDTNMVGCVSRRSVFVSVDIWYMTYLPIFFSVDPLAHGQAIVTAVHADRIESSCASTFETLEVFLDIHEVAWE